MWVLGIQEAVLDVGPFLLVVKELGDLQCFLAVYQLQIDTIRGSISIK